MFIVVTQNALKIELSIEKVHIYIHICINNTHIIKKAKRDGGPPMELNCQIWLRHLKGNCKDSEQRHGEI